MFPDNLVKTPIFCAATFDVRESRNQDGLQSPLQLHQPHLLKSLAKNEVCRRFSRASLTDFFFSLQEMFEAGLRALWSEVAAVEAGTSHFGMTTRSRAKVAVCLPQQRHGGEAFG